MAQPHSDQVDDGGLYRFGRNTPLRPLSNLIDALGPREPIEADSRLPRLPAVNPDFDIPIQKPLPRLFRREKRNGIIS